jgi:hypothetical protein
VLLRKLAGTSADSGDERFDAFAAAVLRGAVAKQEMLEDAGGAWTKSAVARHLGITQSMVDARRRRHQLLAVRSASGEYVFPVCQFTDDDVLPGLDRFLRAFQSGSGWTWLDVLLTPAEEIGGISPLDALRRGEPEKAAVAAAMFGELGGPVNMDV